MNKVVIFALLAMCVFASVKQITDAEAMAAFKRFKLAYNKKYSSEQDTARFAIFKDNLMRIQYMNLNDNGASHGVNQFTDLTQKEFQSMYLGYNPSLKRVSKPANTIFGTGLDAPASVDWVAAGAVTPVKNQGQCGSCWAFSTTGGIEGQYVVQLGKPLTSFSEQQLVDCDHNGDNGCNGGLMDNAFTYLETATLETEAAYPYTAVTGTCKYNASLGLTSTTKYTDVSTDETVIASVLAEVGPLSIAINATPLQTYTSGILNPTFCNPKGLDHGVLLVGYGTQGSTPYWKVKNSWGTSWGEQGYFRIIRGKGKCGLNTAVSYPTLA